MCRSEPERPSGANYRGTWMRIVGIKSPGSLATGRRQPNPCTPWDCHRTADQARGGARGVNGAAYMTVPWSVWEMAPGVRWGVGKRPPALVFTSWCPSLGVQEDQLRTRFVEPEEGKIGSSTIHNYHSYSMFHQISSDSIKGHVILSYHSCICLWCMVIRSLFFGIWMVAFPPIGSSIQHVAIAAPQVAPETLCRDEFRRSCEASRRRR